MHKQLNMIIGLALCLVAFKSSAQDEKSFSQADSITWNQYSNGDWQGLLAEGKTDIANHTDFKNLRLRMGYAAFEVNNYSEAIQQYRAVLALDSYDQTARYYLSICETYLGHTEASMFNSAYAKNDSIPLIGLKGISLESSFKQPNYSLRQTAYYERIGFDIRLGWHLFIEQSGSYFSQQLTSTAPINPQNLLPVIPPQNQQTEYFAKLNYMPLQQFQFWLGYHYLYSSLVSANYQSDLLLFGAKYYLPYFTLQTDADLGSLTGSTISQYNADITVYPFGNLNFYACGRGSIKSGRGSVITGLLGVKLLPRIWLEGGYAYGSLDNYIDADGLYIYNASDATTQKTTIGSLISIGKRTTLSLYYTNEHKNDATKNFNYQQNSITGGISWKF